MRRQGTALAILSTFVALFSFPQWAQADSGTTTPAPSPAALAMSLAGSSRQLPPGAWINSTKVSLHFQIQVTSGKLTPAVEIEPSGTAFTGKPNFQGPPLSASGVATVLVQGLVNGKTYHWQAQVIDQAGTSSQWIPFNSAGSAGPDLGIDQEAPNAPAIRSASDPRQSRWYHNRTVTLTWSSTDRLSGIQGYSFLLGRNPRLLPPGSLTTATGARVTNLADGIWYLGVRSQDRAGNWSQVSRFRLQLDRQAPHVSWLSPSRFTFNPYKGSTSVRFKVDESSAVGLDLFRVGATKPTATYWFPHLRAGTIATITWNGKTRGGAFVPGGYYFFAVRARDRAGNLSRLNLGGINVNPQKPQVAVGGVILYPDSGKRIIVVLSQETLYAYDGNRLVLKTYVTTGNPALPTPTGSYQVMAKYHPYEMISPWPPGSPYYYAPSWMQYAMLFRSGGYFLHDAPWRSVFGPGSNGPGTPGTNYGGTHGCVNIPSAPMTFLFGWTPVGTAVSVVP